MSFWWYHNLCSGVEKVAACFQTYITEVADRVSSKKKSKQKVNKFPCNQWYDQECKDMKTELRRLNANDTGQLDDILNQQREYKRLVQRKKREYPQSGI